MLGSSMWYGGSVAASLLAALSVGACGGGGGAARSEAPASEQAAVAPSPAGNTAAGRTAGSSVPAGAGRAAGKPPAAPGGGKRSGTPAPAHPIPASFRSSGISPGARSDDQVRAELQQMYVVQANSRKLSAAAANFAGLLPWVAEPKSGEIVSVASVFTDYGLGLACGGLLSPNQIGVAHKTAPCGTLIDFTYGGRTLRVPVIDRGPYIVGREWDLTGATAAVLGFPGLGPIKWKCASCR